MPAITTNAIGCNISPSGTTNVTTGGSFTLDIDSGGKQFKIIDNGNDVTNLAVKKQYSTSSLPSSYTTSGSINGTNYTSAVGKSHTASYSTGNDYCTSSGSTAYILYAFSFSSIPSNATITSVTCQVKGHCESTSQPTEVARCQLYAGSTAKGSSTDFTSTTDSVITLNTGTWSRSEINNLKLRFTIGYYGGKVTGATVTVTYTIPDENVFTYTITGVTTAHTITVSTGGIYINVNGSWVQCSSVYLKVNGSWVLQSDISTLFDASKKYMIGG